MATRYHLPVFEPKAEAFPPCFSCKHLTHFSYHEYSASLIHVPCSICGCARYVSLADVNSLEEVQGD